MVGEWKVEARKSSEISASLSNTSDRYAGLAEQHREAETYGAGA